MALAIRELNPAQGVSERHLVTAVRGGDERAFELLHERYRPRITSYVYGLVRDAGRAEDITQEIFISALRRLEATERPIAFKPWIYAIAKNACIDEFRRGSRAALVSLDDGSDGGAPPAPLVDHRSPDVQWERRQQFDDLLAAFSGLSDVHHRLLVMRELEGLSYTEIGERLGMSRGVVESTLFRARRKLSAEFDELASGRQCERVQATIDGLVVPAARAPGIRDRRRASAHLRNCRACLRHARDAGVEESALRVPSVAERVAAVLPLGGLPAFLRRLGARHGASAARGTTIAGAPASVAVSRAIAAVVALAVAGVALPSGAPGHAGSQHIGTVPARLSLAPVSTQVAVPLDVAAARGLEPARTLPIAVLANADAYRALLRASGGQPLAFAGGIVAVSSLAGNHAVAHAAGRQGVSPTGGIASSTPAASAPVTSGGSRPLARARSTASGLLGRLSSSGASVSGATSGTLSSAAGTVSQVGTGVSGATATSGATVAGAGAAVGGAATQASGAIGGPVTQAGQAAGAAVSGTTAAVGAAVAQTGQAAGAATSALTKP